jgi:hypothetical protein
VFTGSIPNLDTCREVGMRDKLEAVEIECPKCKETRIVYIPKEEIPRCPKCNVQMVIRELLDEGKAY